MVAVKVLRCPSGAMWMAQGAQQTSDFAFVCASGSGVDPKVGKRPLARHRIAGNRRAAAADGVCMEPHRALAIRPPIAGELPAQRRDDVGLESPPAAYCEAMNGALMMPSVPWLEAFTADCEESWEVRSDGEYSQKWWDTVSSTKDPVKAESLSDAPPRSKRRRVHIMEEPDLPPPLELPPSLACI